MSKPLPPKPKVLITAALPYANGDLHFGHLAGAYLPSDIYARFERLQGKEVLYVSGSDEYGIAITLSAEIAGRTPKEHVDFYHQKSQEFFQKMDISFDHYSRTTWDGHQQTTTEFFFDLLEGGYIEEKITEQLYSEADNRFLSDRYVTGICPKCKFAAARGDECPECGASFEATDLLQPRSKITGTSLVKKPTLHWFLRFDRFKDSLTKWLQNKHWKPNVKKFAQNYIDELQPRAITRDSEWGIPVPLEKAKGKVFYVWFDAPIGYISATKEWSVEKHAKEKWKEYWLDEQTTLVQFIGKDNIPFHAIFFPAMIMGQKLPYKLVDELPANEFYHLQGKRFSKSDNWSVDIDHFLSRFSKEQLRFTLAANAPETQDSSFSYEDFQVQCNAKLVGTYGNLVNRVLVFALQKCGGAIPCVGPLSPLDQEFLSRSRQLVDACQKAYSTFQVRKSASLLMELASLGNSYFDKKKPWQGAKDQTLRDSMHTTIACCIQSLFYLALISFPILPETAEKLWKMLGQKSSLKGETWESILTTPPVPGTTLPFPQVLFKKIDDQVIREEIDRLEGNRAPSSSKREIPFEAIEKLDLRVGHLIQANPIPKSSKLLQLQVDIGSSTKTIVSKLAKSYKDPSSLIGKKVIVVANLEKATMMGVTSEGIVLTIGDPPLLLEGPNVPAGTPVS